MKIKQNMEINRWWYSEKQKQVKNRHIYSNGKPANVCEVMVNGEWKEYTERTRGMGGCNWDDSVLIAQSTTELPLRINGRVQSVTIKK